MKFEPYEKVCKANSFVSDIERKQNECETPVGAQTKTSQTRLVKSGGDGEI